MLQSLYRYFNKRPGIDPDKPCIFLMAPTGKAAYLIRGNTLHSALKIPVNQKLQYKSLDTDSLNTLRTQMMGVKYIFINEVSMVGSGMLTFVHKRLQEIMWTARDFGGISVIFVGDLFQLKPVCDSFIFKNNCAGYAPLATNLWQQNARMLSLLQWWNKKMEDNLLSYWIECVMEIHRSQIMICLLQGWFNLILKNMLEWKAVCIFTFKMSE